MPAQSFEDFKALLQRAKAGDEEAAVELVRTNETVIRNVVRAKLHKAARRLVDSTDVVQMVWGDFFGNIDHWIDFNDPEQLTAYLVGMARRRALKVNRDLLDREKRDLRRQASLKEVPDPTSPVGSPLHAVMSQDSWEHFLQDREPHEREFLNLLRDGCTLREIADLLGVCDRTARRILAAMREILPTLEV
jgi:RNA polymerase sigma factor (sigma-70 family)